MIHVSQFFLRIPSTLLNVGPMALIFVCISICVASAQFPQSHRDHQQSIYAGDHGKTDVGNDSPFPVVRLPHWTPIKPERGLVSDPPAIRVMSFNIRFGTAQDGENRWDLRKDFLAETIEAFEPDLLGTQETLLSQKNFLDQRLSKHQSIGVGRDNGQNRGEMTALWFRTDRFKLLDSGHFWLSEDPDQPGSLSWDSALTRMVSWVKLADVYQPQAPNILFLNTHFDHVGKQARIESVKLLLKQIETLGVDCSMILAGDFNAAEDSEPYRTLFAPSVQPNQPRQSNQGLQGNHDRQPTQAKLVDTYRHVHPQASDNEGTFSGFQADRISGARIDWIAVSRDWEVVAAAIDRASRQGRTPSDHFPVTAILLRGTLTPKLPK